MVKAILTKKFVLVEKDADGELFIEFPDDLLDSMDWREGDQLTWTERPNGNGWSVTKANRRG
jgi:hypothetical protein|tara:strand:+ start:2124 stop:2309 length:186 start_codon:yes stop_codon:yes gene_type:complete